MKNEFIKSGIELILIGVWMIAMRWISNIVPEFGTFLTEPAVRTVLTIGIDTIAITIILNVFENYINEI